VVDNFERLVWRLWPGAVLLKSRRLEGGVSARVTALDVQHPDGHAERAVVREISEEMAARNPAAPENEFRLLQIVCAEGIPAPRPIDLCQPSDLRSSPFLVLSYIEGARPGVNLALLNVSRQLAGLLARIHRLAASQPGLAFLPDMEERMTVGLAGPLPAGGSLNEEAIRDAIKAAWPRRLRNPRVLLHGDFWPGNTLWLDEELVGIVDWEDAAAGDPIADVGNARLEIPWTSGAEAMTGFTDSYQELAIALDWTDLPVWDLWAAWRGAGLGGWGLDADTERAMRERHSEFVGQALARLGR